MLVGFPRPTWQSIPLQLRRQHHPIGSRGAEYDDRKTCGSGYCVPAVQGDSRVEIRQGVRIRPEVQGGEVYPGGGTIVCGVLVRTVGCLAGFLWFTVYG